MTEQLPPHLERIGQELMAAAHLRAAEPAPRRRRPRRLALIVAFAVLGTTGAALAATSTNPIDWLRGGDPARELRVGVDTTARVGGDFPDEITCDPGIDAARADCRVIPGLVCHDLTTPGGTGGRGCAEPAQTVGADGRTPRDTRRFHLMTRVAAPPHIDASVVRAALAGRAADEQLIPEEVMGPDVPARYRVTVGRVLEIADGEPEDFWRGLETMLSVQGGTTSSSDPANPDNELVPPAGIARFVTCRDDGGLSCRPLGNGELLPVGAPLYMRDPEAGWRSVPRPAQNSAAYLELQRQAFGRDLTAPEQMLLVALLSPVAVEGSGGSATVTATPAP
ncbi:MAG: hypothetical protein IT200_03975 [Thermoleophilia bacterium]|nr:hypothetical protein [Thermoleophilia bacterium]